MLPETSAHVGLAPRILSGFKELLDDCLVALHEKDPLGLFWELRFWTSSSYVRKIVLVVNAGALVSSDQDELLGLT